LWRILISMQFWQFVVLQIIHSNSIIYDSFTYCWPWLLICHKVKSNTKAHAVMCCLCHVKQLGSSASWKESHPQYQYLCIACWLLASRKGRAALWSQKLLYPHVILRHKPSAWNVLDSGKKCFWGCFYCFTYIP
jgi:hypothetical protein